MHSVHPGFIETQLQLTPRFLPTSSSHVLEVLEDRVVGIELFELLTDHVGNPSELEHAEM